MFGSSPKCDFVLTGEGVLPFHGRVRWQAKKQRFKVDASPEAEYLLVNGQKMASSSFRQGDEIQVGGNRIFMIHDGAPEPPAARPPARRRDARPARARPFRARPARGRHGDQAGELAGEPGGRPALGRDGRGRGPATPAPHGAAPARGPGTSSPTVVVPEPGRGWRRLFYVFTARAYAPGQERVLSSPLVFGLGVALAVLVLVGVRPLRDHRPDGRRPAVRPGGREPRRRRLPQRRSAGSTSSSSDNPKDPRAGKAARPPGDGQRPPVHLDRRRLVVAGAGGRAGDARVGLRRGGATAIRAPSWASSS